MSDGKRYNVIAGDGIQLDADDEDFEFPVSGDGIQSEPAYPVFDRTLLLEPDPRAPLSDLRSGSTSSSSSSSSSADDDPKYCLGNLSLLNRCKKSFSTGSVAGSESRRLMIKDLVSGRSRSDGKEKFVFMEKEKRPNPNPNLEKNSKAGEMDLVTAFRLFYGKEGEKGEKGGRANSSNRSGPVGLFPNGNGLSRIKFPF